MESRPGSRKLRVVMLDLLATVPYYSAYTARFLQEAGVAVDLQAITYYLDRECFQRCGVKNRTYLADWVGKHDYPPEVRRPLKLIEYVGNLAALTAHIMRSNPDVLHVQFLPGLKWNIPFERCFLQFARKLRVPIVYTVHDVLPHDTGERFVDTYRKAYALMDRLICHSEDVKVKLVRNFGMDANRVDVIAHGPLFYDCSAAKNQDKDVPLVLWQGLIFPYKGIDFLLDSWRQLMDRGVTARLVISGTGDPKTIQEIKERAETLGLEESVEMDFRYMPVDEMLSLYASADVLVYPYKAVTTSGALLTGLAQGKAIVATDLPYFRQILDNGRLARLVPYGEVKTFATVLQDLLMHNQKRAELEQVVRSCRLGENMWREIADQTVGCYEKVI